MLISNIYISVSELIILFFCLEILLMNIMFLILFYKIRKSIHSSNFQIKISVIVAAKNEKKNVSALLDSIRRLDYPKDIFEVIIIDDNSNDGTYNIIQKEINAGENISVFKLPIDFGSGKKAALSYGIEKSSFDSILITDADCLPEEKWLKAYSKKFNEGKDLIFGIAPYIMTNNSVNKISCFENLRAHMLTIGAAKIGFPYSAASRSLGFNKNSFIKIGGYSNTMELKSGDDDLLIREAVKNKLKIDVVSDEKSFVYSSSKDKFREYFNQKARHTAASNYYLIRHLIFLSIWHLSNLFLIIAPFLFSYSRISLYGIFFKLITDTLVILFIQKRFGYKFKFYEAAAMQIIYELLLPVHYINSFINKNSKWK